MIQVIKGFHKLSDNKNYLKGDKVEFDAQTETRLIKEGLAKKVVVKKVTKKKSK